jgi:hypothetical protein
MGKGKKTYKVEDVDNESDDELVGSNSRKALRRAGTVA